MKLNNNRAFSLLEVMIATVIASLVIVATFNLLISTSRNSKNTKEFIIARQIAKYLTANIVNRKFSEIISDTYYFNDKMEKLEGDGKYKAVVTINNINDNLKKIEVVVNWDNSFFGSKSVKSIATAYNDTINSIP